MQHNEINIQRSLGWQKQSENQNEKISFPLNNEWRRE
jgi:hypothetical protein